MIQVKQHANELFVQTKTVYDTSTLPEGPDYERVEKLLVNSPSEHLLDKGVKSM